MGSLSWVRVSVAVVLLLVTGILVEITRNVASYHVTTPLSAAFTTVGDWQAAGDIPLDDAVREALYLDDHLFRRFSNGHAVVELYIGYYHSLAKVGAAHDPLVCFPGQGWVLRNKQTVARTIQDPNGDLVLKYTTVTAERNSDQDLLLYWFQAGRKMAAGTFMQKVYAVQAKLFGQEASNAFVRVSIPLKGVSVAEGKEALTRFATDFYPVFSDFVGQASATKR
ncbi:MAG: EpsI family protein [Desulfobulbus oligotrophicus]|jgi:EpsI family protein|nr:EpsI family protein [Desulfobulbus oligotrophicus]